MALGRVVTTLFLASVLLVVSCGKNESDDPAIPDFGQGTGRCRISKRTETSGTMFNSVALTYDNDNRLIKVTDSINNRFHTLTYNGNIIKIERVASGAVTIRDSVVLDNSGRIVAIYETTPSDSDYARLFYSYAANGEAMYEVFYLGGNFVDTNKYTWMNGDMIQFSFPGVVLRHTYNSISAQYANEMQYYDFVNYGIPITRTAHMLSTFTNNSNVTTTHSYHFDIDGKVLNDTLRSPGNTAIHSFQYECQ